jgi:hypothetical protein
MTHFPPPAIHEQRRKVLRYVGIALSAGMVLLMMIVLGLIIWQQSKHNLADCPYALVSERPFAGGKVIEEQRACVEQFSERRYLVAREGKEPYELAIKRLAPDRFDPKRYTWDVSNDDNGLLVLKLKVDGKLSSEFHEEDAVDR